MSDRYVSIGMTPTEDTTRIPMYLDVSRIVEAVSPHVTLTQTDDGVVITVEDIDGTKTATVYDGETSIALSITSNLFAIPCDNDGIVLENYTTYANVRAFRGTDPVIVTYLGQSGNTSTATVGSTTSPYGNMVYVNATKDRALFESTPSQRSCAVQLAFSVEGKTFLVYCNIIAVREGKNGKNGEGGADVWIATQTYNLPCAADGKIITTIDKYLWFNGMINGVRANSTKLTNVIANQPAGGVTIRKWTDATSQYSGQVLLQSVAGEYPFVRGTAYPEDSGTWMLEFDVDGIVIIKTIEVAAVKQGETGPQGAPGQDGKNYAGLADRVEPLNGSALSVDNTVDVDGVPEYVADVSEYSDYGITEPGWYVFARITAKDGVSVTAQTTVTGADGYIMTVGGTHIDVAVRFEVAAMAKRVAVTWGGETETFVFRATDLAVRNLDYRTTFYLFDLSAFVTWSYALTTDATFATGKRYFTLADGEYVEAVEGVDWTAGDVVPADTYYKHSKLHIEGMTRNVTYKLDEIVDAPIEIALPVVADDGYGAWYEIQLRYDGSYSCTLLPPEGVKIGTVSTQNQTAGINVIDLQYTGVGGVQMWSLLNTHSNIPA